MAFYPGPPLSNLAFDMRIRKLRHGFFIVTRNQSASHSRLCQDRMIDANESGLAARVAFLDQPHALRRIVL